MILGLAFGIATCAMAQTTPPPNDTELAALLQQRLRSGSDTGIIVGVVGPAGTRVVAAGKAGPGSVPPLDARTVFEIGSATKVFTTALLVDMVNKGEVKLDDPVAAYLPTNVKVPTRGGRQITLVDLATHTSGLPRLPANLQARDPSNPYADYSVPQLYDFLSHCELTRDIGDQYEYSNLGMGLLGHALALRGGKSYEELVTERILRPLHMNDTVITLTGPLRARLAIGHDAAGKAVANWDIPTLAGAGALRSTLDDMLRFLQANLDSDKAGVPALLHTAHVARHGLTTPNASVGLGWHIMRAFGREIVWHNGATGGYHSFIGFDQKARTGVVMLHNSADGIDDVGFHLIDAHLPLNSAPPGPKARSETKVDENVLEKYVGEYQLAPTFSIVVTREAGQLFLQATGQSKLPIYAESETEFFLKAVDARITFVRGSNDRAVRLVLHQGGRDLPGERK
jgi:CubicO group peptidase (beta-lactamase class C family)